MNPEYLPYEIIDRFLTQQMSENERMDFEKALNQDPDLMLTFQAQRAAYTMVVDFEMLKLKNKIESDLTKEVKKNPLKIWGVGIFLFIGIISLIYFLLPNKKKVDRLKNRKTILADSNTHTPVRYPEPIIQQQNKTNQAPHIIPKMDMFFNRDSAEPYTKHIQFIPFKSIDSSKTDVDIKANDKDPVNRSLETVVCPEAAYIGIPITTPSCKDDHSGSIFLEIENITAGKKPYSFSLSLGSPFQRSSQFNSLEEGHYQIFIKDTDGCIAKICDATIGRINCQKKSYSFAPDLQSEWSIPMSSNSKANIKLVDKTGTPILSKSIENGISNSWNGIGNSGQPVPGGLYIGILQYESGEIENFELTIVR